MSDNFGMADLTLIHQQKVVAKNQEAFVRDEEVVARTHQHGWKQSDAYAYDVYNAKTPQDRDNAARLRLEQEATDQAARDLEAGQIARQKGEEVVNPFNADVPLWASGAVKYEWQEEFGDIGPAHPELEAQLYRDQFINRSGIQFEHLNEIKVTIESVAKVKPVLHFEDAGLHPAMLQNVKLCGYQTPTPIQAFCMPAILENHDVIAVAQTGSGKTAAFLIPILSKLMGKAKKLAAPRPNVVDGFDARVNGVEAQPLVLIIAPTRELSVQIFDEARRLCYRSMLRPCVAYGGGPARDQAIELRKGCDVLIGTPGRLVDFLNRVGLLSFRRVRYTVIDEADELVSPDWLQDMTKLLSDGDKNEDADHRYMLFSATFPKEARKLAAHYLDGDHIRLTMGRAGSTLDHITQFVVAATEPTKEQMLYQLLMDHAPARTIIFVNNKRSADQLDDFLYNQGFPSTSLHSDRTQREREDALRSFRSGRSPLLVATGVSARGLDIKNVMHVINYDLPSIEHGGIEEYVHRIGRTGRIGNEGIATSFYTDKDESLAPMLVKLLLESKQFVPEFLEQHKPEEGKENDWDDASDDEENGEEEFSDNWATANDDAGTGDIAQNGNDGKHGSSGNDAELTASHDETAATPEEAPAADSW